MQKLKRGNNSENTGDRVLVLASCNFPHSPLSVYQVSLNSSILLEICAGQKCDGRTFYTNGSFSAKSDDRVMVLVFCTFPNGPLSIYQVSFYFSLYFQRYAPDKRFIAKIEKGK